MSLDEIQPGVEYAIAHRCEYKTLQTVDECGSCCFVVADNVFVRVSHTVDACNHSVKRVRLYRGRCTRDGCFTVIIAAERDCHIGEIKHKAADAVVVTSIQFAGIEVSVGRMVQSSGE